jgi:HEAT repeat protein
LLPEPILIERAAERGIYAVARDPETTMPLDEYRQAAALSAEGPSALPELLTALANSDPVVRYWGAVGLGALGADARTALPSLFTMLDDASPSVRIAAAQSICTIGTHPLALRRLAEALQNEEDTVRILAANAIDNLGEKADPLLPECQAALADKNQYVVRVMKHTVARLSVED